MVPETCQRSVLFPNIMFSKLASSHVVKRLVSVLCYVYVVYYVWRVEGGHRWKCHLHHHYHLSVVDLFFIVHIWVTNAGRTSGLWVASVREGGRSGLRLTLRCPLCPQRITRWSSQTAHWASVGMRAFPSFCSVWRKSGMQIDVLWQQPLLWQEEHLCLLPVQAGLSVPPSLTFLSASSALITSDGRFLLERAQIYCAIECVEGFLGRWTCTREMEKDSLATKWVLLTLQWDATVLFWLPEMKAWRITTKALEWVTAEATFAAQFIRKRLTQQVSPLPLAVSAHSEHQCVTS